MEIESITGLRLCGNTHIADHSSQMSATEATSKIARAMLTARRLRSSSTTLPSAAPPAARMDEDPTTTTMRVLDAVPRCSGPLSKVLARVAPSKDGDELTDARSVELGKRVPSHLIDRVSRNHATVFNRELVAQARERVADHVVERCALRAHGYLQLL
jgi:hypothetical protein